MDIPDLVRQALGDEEIQAGVSLGDEDAVCLTPTRTIVYKGDGLLSDERVAEYSHDVERIAVSEGRRKTKFLLEYIEGTESFTVPSNRDEKVLELLLEGVLRLAGVIDQRESLVGVYRFSELTLIVAERRMIKLIGEQVWNDDFEVYDYDDVTGLEFERASVATSVVLAIEGRPQRVKVPNDKAPIVRQTIEEALFGYYDVGTLAELNRVVDTGDEEEVSDAGATDDIDFGSGIDPLVTDDEDEDEAFGSETAEVFSAESAAERETYDATGDEDGVDPATATETVAEESATPAAEASNEAAAAAGESEAASGDTPDGTADSDDVAEADAARTDVAEADTADSDTSSAVSSAESSATAAARGGDGAGDESTDQSESDSPAAAADDVAGASDEGPPADPVTREELAAVADQMAELTEAVDRQNELLKRQHRAIKQLASQLQSE